MQKLILVTLLFLFFSSESIAATANADIVSGTLTIPPRIGITKNGHAREKPGSATISPAAEAARVTVSTTSPNIKLSGFATNTATGVITFTITGVTESAKPDDVPVIATHVKNGLLDTKTLSVIIPKGIPDSHPTFNGPVTPVNLVTNASTIPADPSVPAGQVRLATHWQTTLTIPVNDQFDIRCGDIYAGATITEGGIVTNLTLSSAGTYDDIVGLFRTPVGGGLVPAGSPAALAWPTQPTLTTTTFERNVSKDVEVDGFMLDPGAWSRTAEFTLPNNLEIIWP